jgi:peptidyl-tRNA hydrolase, PTH1 family
VVRPRIVLGLGNPGAAYRLTRHNLGFQVLDGLATRWRASFRVDRETSSWTAEAALGPHPVLLAKPRTFMNRSGRAASALCRGLGVGPDELLVVYDDADLELGRVRVRPRGTAGGHNGLQSILDTLATLEIPRLRLGVCGAGRAAQDLADYVLSPFEPAEQAAADELALRGVEVVESILELGLAAAMARGPGRC